MLAGVDEGEGIVRVRRLCRREGWKGAEGGACPWVGVGGSTVGGATAKGGVEDAAAFDDNRRSCAGSAQIGSRGPGQQRRQVKGDGEFGRR